MTQSVVPMALNTSFCNIHERETSVPLVGFEDTIPATERPQIHTLDRETTDAGSIYSICAHCEHLSLGRESRVIALLCF
jgi:hypothetical protein